MIDRGRQERTPIEIFTEEEALAVVREAETPQDAAIFQVAFREGLRRGELVALQVRDVDFVGRNLHVRRNYVRGVLSTPKGRRERVVPLNIDVAHALENLLRDRDDPDDDELLFPDPDTHGLLDPDDLSARFRAARDVAGVRRLPLKHTRHTYCSRLAAAGVHVTKIQEWAGHVSITTTQRYMVFAPSDQDADTVDQAFAVKPVIEAGDGDDPVEALQQQVQQLTETLARVVQERKTSARDDLPETT